MRAMAGCDPLSGERLKPEHGRTKVAAFDLTFSAPKSVSVLFAIGDAQTAGVLLEAHERAVEAAFGYVERETCFTRRGRNGIRRVRGDGFVAAAYRHRLSRAGDPLQGYGSRLTPSRGSSAQSRRCHRVNAPILLPALSRDTTVALQEHRAEAKAGLL